MSDVGHQVGCRPRFVRPTISMLTFHAIANDHVQAVIVLVDGMFFEERIRIAVLAAAWRDYLLSMASVSHVDAEAR